MSLLNRTLAKLSINAYSDRDLKNNVGAIAAMYNPDSLHLSYQINYEANEFINSTVKSNNYTNMHPGDLMLELVFDSRMPGNKTSVEDQLCYLRQLCSTVNPSSGEPNFLRVEWGNVRWGGKRYYAGRMRSLTFNYTLFDRDATPLRATATLALTADESINLQNSEQSLQAPPFSVLSVVDGDGGLPLITGLYLLGVISCLRLAWNNDLDNLHDIAPGDTLIAPAQDGGQA
jgi:Contractile injection system tube protein